MSNHLTDLDSPLTPDGVPVEVSLSEGSDAFRYVIDPGAGQPNFAARLAAARDMVFDPLIVQFIDALFPQPECIDPAARFGVWLGAADVGVSKIYGNLRLDELSLSRLAQQWPAYARLADRALVDLFEPMGAGLVVRRDGDLSHKLYVSPWDGLEHQAIEHLAVVYGVDARLVFDQVNSLQLSRLLWGPSVVMSLKRTGFTMYLATLPLYRQGTDVLDLARRAAATRDQMQAQLERLLAVTATAWRVTWLGWNFSPVLPGSRLTIYLAPRLGDLHHLDPAVADQKAAAGGQIGR